MASCDLRCQDNISLSEAGVCHCSHQTFKVACHKFSCSIRKKHPPLLIHPYSHLPFNLARVLKNNHPGHAPLLPIISLIYPHLSLRFLVLLSILLILSSFNCLCRPLFHFCFVLFPSSSFHVVPQLTFSSLYHPLAHYFLLPLLFSLTLVFSARQKQKFFLGSFSPIFIIQLLRFNH